VAVVPAAGLRARLRHPRPTNQEEPLPHVGRVLFRGRIAAVE
jgi:hypothetical protein